MAERRGTGHLAHVRRAPDRSHCAGSVHGLARGRLDGGLYAIRCGPDGFSWPCQHPSAARVLRPAGSGRHPDGDGHRGGDAAGRVRAQHELDPGVARHHRRMSPVLDPVAKSAASAHPHATLRAPWIWSILGALMLTNVAILFAIDRSWTEALTFGLTMGGFMLFAAASSFLVRSEAAARAELASTNTELLATRAMLVETSRVEERLRISRDLHDTLGHHLTALSLQLDVAARLSQGRPSAHIQQAHAITRLLLGDVRDVVSRLRETSQLDVAQAIRAMTVEQAGLALHLDLPASLVVDEASRADTLLRCVQEIVTNTTRHAQARKDRKS